MARGMWHPRQERKARMTARIEVKMRNVEWWIHSSFARGFTHIGSDELDYRTKVNGDSSSHRAFTRPSSAVGSLVRVD